MDKYNPSEIEGKWQEKWEKEKIYSPNLDSAKKPFYNLMMFPYPSAEGMHVGNMYAFTGADVYGRFMRMKGFDVFEPIGLDGFGIHSENYAIKVGKHPAEQAKISEENFYRQLHTIGNSFDWSRTVETYKPEYYKWTQWIFIQLFKNGLAYRAKAQVNWCPLDKTVLADEQVIDGKCERDGAVVEKRELEQWFLKITDYAERLLNNIEKLNWSEKVKVAQKNWIGKSEGATIQFTIDNLPFTTGIKKNSQSSIVNNQCIGVFTTRPDTLYGATFLVLAPEHPVSQSIKDKKLQEYIVKAKAKSDLERMENKEKTGVFSGLHAINPLNQEKIPVWIADFVVGSYGTGAVFADAHDERDFEFAKKYGIPLHPTLKTGDPNRDKRIKNLEECFTGDGILVDSGEFSGLTSAEARKKIVEWLKKKGAAKTEVNYHLRDWLISRQRYWSPPIPMIYCDKCDWQPVPEKDLPVLLPEVSDWKPKGTGKSPLASVESFINTKCPKCGGDAKRETDVSDTFLDSSWYFLRYLATDFDSVPFPMEKSKINSALRAAWLPVNMYIGGAEHSVLHLLYSRFITMVLFDLKLLDFEEPYERFYAHGLLIKDGAKMSKSKGNVIVPDTYIAKFGADTLRMYLMFLGPFSAGGDFRDSGIEGMNRFLRRVWTLLEKYQISNLKSQISNIDEKQKKELDRTMNKTIKSVTEDMGNLRYNTAIAHLMEYYNELSDFYTKYSPRGEAGKTLDTKYCKTFVLLLAPFAPHMAEELWSKLGNKSSIHLESWPAFDESSLEESEVNIAVSVNGKTRDVIKVQSSKVKSQKLVEQLAMESANVKRHITGKKVDKTIYVEGKIINFVT